MSKKAAAQVARFNERYPVGTPVIVSPYIGEKDGQFHTKTRTAAEVLSGHTAVVWVEGRAGCYCLDAVTAIPEKINV